MSAMVAVFQVLMLAWLLPLVGLAAPEAFACTPSVPDSVPPPIQPSTQLIPGTTISNDGIWASIPDDGRVEISKDFIEQDGEYKGWRGTKFMWTRGDGVVGPLIITGKRLDVEAPAAVDLVYVEGRQYGTMGFTPTWLTFPTPGCWEITGTVGEHQIVFIMEVVFVDSYRATPTA